MSDPIIEAQDIGLAYRLDRNRAGTFKEFAINMFRGQVEHDTLWALRGLNFRIEQGEIFGVVGPNGAGKSTLMKIIARVLPPTEGRVVVRGNVAAMIALGAGFNPELTARENIVMYGALLGRDIKLMRDRVGPIVEWAELEDFVDVPTRSFSSGMVARLAFSVATDTGADVLVVDEILSVGDHSFKKKSTERMEKLIADGSSVVLVSHSLALVRKMCDRVMWLDKGIVRMLGEPEEVVAAYEAAADAKS